MVCQKLTFQSLLSKTLWIIYYIDISYLNGVASLQNHSNPKRNQILKNDQNDCIWLAMNLPCPTNIQQTYSRHTADNRQISGRQLANNYWRDFLPLCFVLKWPSKDFCLPKVLLQYIHENFGHGLLEAVDLGGTISSWLSGSVAIKHVE